MPFHRKNLMQNDTDTSRVGRWVRDLRQSMGLSQAELAARASCGVHAVWELEARGNGTMAILQAVTAALDGRWIGFPRGSSLPERTKAARLRAGLSMDALAALAGVSKGSIIRLEQGTARVATFEAVLPLIAPGCSLRKPQVLRWVGGGDRDSRFTPPSFLAKLTDTLGPIELDPCWDARSHVVAARTFTEADDGLLQDWASEGLVFVNPPFSRAFEFTRKAIAEWRSGRAKKIVLLVKARVDGAVFHDEIIPVADVLLLRSRVGFVPPAGHEMPSGRANFGVMLCLLGIDEEGIQRLRRAISSLHLPPRPVASVVEA